MSAEGLLRLLSTPAPNLTGVPAGHGGLKAIDLAGALALSGLSDEVSFFVRVKHAMAGDEQLTKINSMRIQRTLLTILQLQGVNWPLNKSALLCDLVVRLDIIPLRCFACAGHGVIKGHRCQDCGGTAKQRISESKKAAFIGVRPKSYRGTWSKREADLMEILAQWDKRAGQHVHNQINK